MQREASPNLFNSFDRVVAGPSGEFGVSGYIAPMALGDVESRGTSSDRWIEEEKKAEKMSGRLHSQRSCSCSQALAPVFPFRIK
jgi:hypothetical protein